MKLAAIIGMLVLGTFAATNAAQEEKAEKKPEARKDTTIFAVEGEPEEFKVSQGDVVRITPDAPAGVTATVKTTGPVKQSRKATVKKLGGVVGPSGLEYEFATTGKGEASVTFTLKGGPIQEPKTVKYSFTVN